MAKDYTDTFLDDLEKEKIQQFYDDEIMREAVRKVLLAGLYENGVLKKGKKAQPLFNFALGFVSNRGELSNEQVGAQLRSAWEGINALELAFSNLAKYKREEPQVKVKNPAR